MSTTGLRPSKRTLERAAAQSSKAAATKTKAAKQKEQEPQEVEAPPVEDVTGTKTAAEGRVSTKQAAVAVLAAAGKPLHVNDIFEGVMATPGIRLGAARGGKTPKATLAAILSIENKKADGLVRRTKPGTYTLRKKKDGK